MVQEKPMVNQSFPLARANIKGDRGWGIELQMPYELSDIPILVQRVGR